MKVLLADGNLYSLVTRKLHEGWILWLSLMSMKGDGRRVSNGGRVEKGTFGASLPTSVVPPIWSAGVC